ncbi:MAG: hypothetical protein KBD60_02730 [Sterolibacterium sp.]|jgi:hypothetical protein|nr:hypothetical protein [Sterolibacterium sp.]
MPAAIHLVPLVQAAPDMVLASPVLRADGGLLLPAGTRLDAAKLLRLQELGVRDIEVLPEAPAAVADADVMPSACDEDAVRIRVRRLFRKSESDAVTQGLFKAVLEYRLDRLERLGRQEKRP